MFLTWPLSNNQNAENVTPISNVNDVNIQSNSLGNSSDSGSSGDSPSDPNDNFVQTPLSTINTNSRRNVNRTRSKNNEYFSQLKDINVNSNINYTELNGLEALNKEIGQYKSSFFASPYDSQMNKALGPLAFFKANSVSYPILTKIARGIFCITATSVPSECLFSSTGLIQTDLRNRLGPDTLENITFLKENLKF